jgi:hypothetical protein
MSEQLRESQLEAAEKTGAALTMAGEPLPLSVESQQGLGRTLLALVAEVRSLRRTLAEKRN